MVSYLGNFIVFGTSKGISVATVNDRGQLEVQGSHTGDCICGEGDHCC